jgi:hypothetical protein
VRERRRRRRLRLVVHDDGSIRRGQHAICLPDRRCAGRVRELRRRRIARDAASSNAAILQRGGKVRVKKEGVGGGEGAELNFNVEKLKVNLTFSPAAVATFAHARSLTTFVPKVEKSTVTFGPRLAGHPWPSINR